MSTLYVRNVPDRLHRKVKALARRSRHSISAEVVVLLDEAVEGRAVRESQVAALDRIERRMKSYTPPPGSADSLSLLHEGRER